MEQQSVSVTSMRQIFLAGRITAIPYFLMLAVINYLGRKIPTKRWGCVCVLLLRSTHCLSHVRHCNWRQEALSDLSEQIKAMSEQQMLLWATQGYLGTVVQALCPRLNASIFVPGGKIMMHLNNPWSLRFSEILYVADPVSDSHSLEISPISTILPAFIIFTGKQLQGVKGLTNWILEHSLGDREMMVLY